MARHGVHGRHKATPASQAPTEQREYLVQEGDTFSSIAKSHGVATASLLAMNGLSWSSGIAPGQRILVPAAGPATATTTQLTGHHEIIRHRIASGETVSAIAAQYGITRAAILRANGLHPTSLIFVDQVLLIPALSVDTQATPMQRALAG